MSFETNNFYRIEPQYITIDNSIREILIEKSLVFLNVLTNNGVRVKIKDNNVMVKFVLIDKGHYDIPCITLKIGDYEVINLNKVSDSADIFYDGERIIRIR